MNSLTIRRLVYELYLIIFIGTLVGTMFSYGTVYTSLLVVSAFQALLASLVAYFVYEDGKELK